MSTKKPKARTAKEFDDRIDAGDDFFDIVDVKDMYQKILVRFPQLMVNDLDAEAKRRGIARTALILNWLTDKLDALPQERRQGVRRKDDRKEAG